MDNESDEDESDYNIDDAGKIMAVEPGEIGRLS